MRNAIPSLTPGVALVFLCSTGCAWQVEGTPPEAPAPRMDPVGQPDGGPPARPAGAGDAGPGGAASTGPQPEQIEGVYATRQLVTTIAAIPVVGAVENRTLTFLRQEVRQTAHGLQVAQRMCGVRMESSNTLVTRMTLAPGYLHDAPEILLPAVYAAGELSVEGALELRGCALDDPRRDPLPQTAQSPQIRDADGDGNPGFSVLLEVNGLGRVDLYVVARQLVGQVARFSTPDGGAGLTRVETFEQVTIGATHSLFATTQEMAVSNERSTAVMRRIEPAMDCAAILAADEVALFGALP